MTARPSPRPVVGLISAQSMAYMGTRLAMIALPWFVLETTGSPAHMGLVTAVEMGFYGLARLLGGPLMDRIGQRVVGVWANSLAAATLVCVPLLHGVGLLSFPILLILVALVGLTTGPAEAAKASLTPFVAEASGTHVERVAGLTGTVDRLSMTVGPVAAGAIVAALGVVPAFYLNAVLMLGASVTLALFVPRTRPGVDDVEDAEAGESYLARLHTGWKAAWGDIPLRVVVLTIMVTNLIDITVLSVILPIWVHSQGLGPDTVGLVAGALGVTSLLGSLVAAWIGHRLPRIATFVVTFVLSGPPRILVLALDVPLWVVLVVWGLSGFGGGLINPILSAIIFERLPRAVVGRGMAMVGALSRLGVPLGAPVLGALVGAVGAAPVLVGSAVAYLLSGLFPLHGRVRPGLRRPEERSTTTPRVDEKASESTPEAPEDASGPGGDQIPRAG